MPSSLRKVVLSSLPVNLDDEEEPADLTFTVVDTGKGIPPTEIAKLFEPFVQLESEPNRRHGGTGLGLAISRRLVRAMGGTLTAASEEDVGSVFTVNLTLRPLLPHKTSPTTSFSSHYLGA